MKNLYLVGFVLVSTFLLPACSSFSPALTEYQKQMTEAGCKREGEVMIAPTGLWYQSVSGRYKFECDPVQAPVTIPVVSEPAPTEPVN